MSSSSRKTEAVLRLSKGLRFRRFPLFSFNERERFERDVDDSVFSFPQRLIRKHHLTVFFASFSGMANFMCNPESLNVRCCVYWFNHKRDAAWESFRYSWQQHEPASSLRLSC